MDSTEENNNKVLPAEIQESGPIDHPENGHNEFVMQAFLDDYAYCVTEDTVEGMHLAIGKPHHAYQMNI